MPDRQKMHVVTVKHCIILDDGDDISHELSGLVQALQIAHNGPEPGGKAADFYMPQGSFQIAEVGPEEDWRDASELIDDPRNIPGWPVSRALATQDQSNVR